MTDIAERRYSDVHLSAFITACSAVPLDTDETISLTRAMVDVGERLQWSGAVIVDKHSVGGLPGNRTTPIIVSIMAAEGLIMPKTSSRAITSPAGTADTMEVLAPVDLDVSAIRKVVEREGGCIAWGGAVNLSPADDVIIGVERVLDIDAVGQMVASVLSKKIAAGATHLVIDIPVGPTAKVRGTDAADTLERALSSVAQAFGLRTRVMRGPGAEPIGRGIGPALEAQDILAVLRGSRAPRISPTGPASWREDCLSSLTRPRPAKAMRVRGRVSKAAGLGQVPTYLRSAGRHAGSTGRPVSAGYDRSL
jgi:thymidine phosphorylase